MNISPVICGFDGGNGSTKLVIDGVEKRCPACYYPLHNNIHDVADVPDGALVEYLQGSRTDLEGSRWLTGSAAWNASPLSVLRVVDDRHGKLNFGLQLLLGAIGCLPYQPVWNLLLVASIQDAEAFGDRLAATLDGSHKVRFQGSRVSNISIRVIQVVEEGLGALVEATALNVLDVRGRQNILLDLGHGTTIASVFGSGGRLIHRSVGSGGVDALLGNIAAHIETRQYLARQGDTELLRLGLENGSFLYGTTGWSFASIYQKELPPWARDNLAIALKSVDAWRESAAAILAVGGGAQLPGIAALLAAKGIKTLENSTMANARGLHRFGQLKQSDLRRAG